MNRRPAASEFPPAFAGYVELVPETAILPVLQAQPGEVEAATRAVPNERESHAYAPGKWSIREVLGHLIDGERVFGFRAYCFSRGDPNPLPGFDEDTYVARSPYARTPLRELVSEFAAVRRANLAVLGRLDASLWSEAGMANGNSVSVRALAFMMAGHVRHHLGVLAARYGVGGVQRT